ncbi:MAG: hypothetical protein WC713_13680 [Candidatus Methylomirabilota bacterium]
MHPSEAVPKAEAVRSLEDTDRRLMLISEVAERLNVDRRYLNEWINLGLLDPPPIEVGLKGRRTIGVGRASIPYRPLGKGYLVSELVGIRQQVEALKQRRTWRPYKEAPQ